MLTWTDVLSAEKQQPYFLQMLAKIHSLRQSGRVIYPAQNDVFAAFSATPFNDVKVVILGQDPYHGENQAHGLCFSVQRGVKIPPSLVNIYKELERDIKGFERPTHGCLSTWAEQGVLLLNTVLTVEAGQAHSHAKLGWETFTDTVIEQINCHLDGVIFLLWGGHAQRKAKYLDTGKHHILTAPHPSPLSAHRGFIGCGHFSTTNSLLTKAGASAIDWSIAD